MGTIWLPDLADVVAAAGLDVRTWPGWETRARSSGGYDALDAVFCHHTASDADPDDDCAYMWDNATDRPIGAMLLERTGRVTVGAAGATNTQGKGGPLGGIPKDKGNVYGIAVEAANNGVGEPWPIIQQQAYVVLVAALCDAYCFDATSQVWSHWEWCQPSCPGRKTDPAGPSDYATGTVPWDMRAFRADVCSSNDNDNWEDDDMLTDDDVARIANAVWQLRINTVDGSQNTATVLGRTYAAAVETEGDATRSAPQAIK